MLKRAVDILAGLIGVPLYLALTGILVIHADAVANGAVIDWSSQVVAVREPTAPWVQHGGLLILNVLVVSIMLLQDNRAKSYRGPTVFGMGLTIAIIVGIASSSFPHPGGIGADGPVLVTYLREGALASSSIAMLAFVLVWSFVTIREHRRRASPTEHSFSDEAN